MIFKIFKNLKKLQKKIPLKNLKKLHKKTLKKILRNAKEASEPDQRIPLFDTVVVSVRSWTILASADGAYRFSSSQSHYCFF
jgi:CMP-N-acetylneuraminic acid synthetase